MRVAVAGSRDAWTRDEVRRALSDYVASGYKITTLLSGGCRGVDRWAEEWASDHGVDVEVFPAEWGTHGRAAGPIRNAQIAEACDELLAFWDGSSRGTSSMINEAKRRGKPFRVFWWTGAMGASA